jgi:WD40 repeat protein
MRKWNTRYGLYLLLFVSIGSGFFYPRFANAEKLPEILIFKESASDVDALYFSADGRYIRSAAYGMITEWDLATGDVSRKYLGKNIMSLFAFKEFDTRRRVTMRTSKFPVEYETYIKTIFSPDGKHMLQGYFVLYDVASGNPIVKGGNNVLSNILKKSKGRVWSWRGADMGGDRHFGGSFLRPPDRRYALHGGFSYIDLATGKTMKYHHGIGCPGKTVFSQDGRYVIFTNYCNYSGKTNSFHPALLDVQTGKENRFEGEGHADPIECVASSPDGRYAVSGSRDFTLKLWDVKTGKEIRSFEGHGDRVNVVAFSPDSQLIISGSDDNTLRLWEVGSEQEIDILKPSKEYEGSFTAASFSPNGRYVLTSNSLAVITLWEVSEGREAISINAGKKVRSITFSQDGRHVITGHENGHIKIWETESLQLIATMSTFDDGEWAIITPEGYFNASKDGGKHLKVRAGRSVYSINKFYDRFYNPALVTKKLRGRKVVLAHDIRKGVATPPQVRIINPRKGVTFDKGNIDIVIKVVNRGGGIDEVRLYQNDCALGGKKRGLTIKTMVNELEKTFNVTLVPGENRFRAVGFSKDRTESDSHEIAVSYAGGKKEIDLYLVVIGINDYKNPSLKLNFAVADAMGLKDLFEKKWNNLFNNLHLLEIYDKDATKKNIRRLLSGMGSKEQDVVLVFLAGHGLNIKDEWFFLPYDVVFPEKEEHVKERGISSIEMKEMIMNNRSLKKALFVDACKSGGMLLALSRGIEDRRAIAQLARSTGTHIVAASTDKQFASEISQLGHGVFTYALLQGLNGEASNRDETVTVRELIAYIEQKLPSISEKYRQKPQYPVVDSRGQDFPLVVNRVNAQ